MITPTQLVCGLFGHDYLRRWERTCLSLRCANCGHESAGWHDLGPAPGEAPAPRRQLVPLVSR